VTTTIVAKNTVAGIPSSILVTHTFGTATCKVAVTGLPGPVTAGTARSVKHGCEAEIEGVWPTPGAKKVTLKFTSSTGGTATVTLTVNVLAEPCENDAVGVGSDTITPLTDQLSTDFNNTLAARSKCGSTTYYETWDAVNPVTGAIGDSIPEKADCASIGRPDGSSAGIGQLAKFTNSSSGPLCTNFARSSRPRGTSDPSFAPGGVAFTALAGDAVSWAAPAVNTAAPATLTMQQLNQIYTCSVTNWNQVGGGNQAIAPFLPQSGSGTLSFFLGAIGVSTPGPCVSNNGNMLEENEGVNPVLNNPGAIFPYSVGDYIAQTFHADKCLNSACTANSSGVICKKTPDKVQFWCNVHGTMTPKQINGIAPTTGSGSSTKINTAFPATFQRTLFDVVPFDPGTTDHIPGATSPVGGLNLEQLFAKTGFDCASSTAKADITAYGFLNLPACGATN
jgi:ABC-type phosphate transport system substrate-binding protein